MLLNYFRTNSWLYFVCKYDLIIWQNYVIIRYLKFTIITQYFIFFNSLEKKRKRVFQKNSLEKEQLWKIFKTNLSFLDPKAFSIAESSPISWPQGGTNGGGCLVGRGGKWELGFESESGFEILFEILDFSSMKEISLNK